MSSRVGYKYWSIDEDSKLKDLHSKGFLYSDIALLLGRSYGSVISRARTKNLQSRVPFYTKSEDAYIRRFYGFKSSLEISNHLKRDPKSVMARAFKLGLKGRYLGGNHWSSVHSDHDIELMRQLHDDGLSMAEISRKMEINYSYLKSVLNYKNRTVLTLMH